MDRSNNRLRHDQVARLFREIREKRGLTQRDLASLVSRDQAIICRIENGTQRVSLVDFLDWCDALGLDPADILKESLG